MTASSHKKPLSPGRIIGFFIAIPVILTIMLAIFLAFASVLENMRFAQATNQLLELVAVARDYAAHERGFANRSGVDLLPDLVHSGMMHSVDMSTTPSHMTNPWGDPIQAASSAASVMRIEIGLPVRNCRRLAMFLVGSAHDLGLQLMEAREAGGLAWRRFYEGTPQQGFDPRPIEAACGQAPDALLALVFRLR